MTKLTYYTGRHKNPKWIHYNKRSKKYCINRTIKNFRTYFGCYDTLEEAEHNYSDAMTDLGFVTVLLEQRRERLQKKGRKL